MTLIKVEPGEELILNPSPTWFVHRCVVLNGFAHSASSLTRGKPSFFPEKSGFGMVSTIPRREQKALGGPAAV